MVEQVAPKFSSLTHFDTRQCHHISTRALEAIGRNCKALMSLSWVRNPAMWMTSRNQSHKHEALAIARTMPKLKRLIISWLKLESPVVFDILSGCPELEMLDIKWCWGLDILDSKLFDEYYPMVKVVSPYTGAYCKEFSDCEDYNED